MSRPLRIAVDARSLLCANPRGEGKSLLRLYEELSRLQPDITPVFFGDVAAERYTGRLPARAEVVSTRRFGDRANLWEDLWFPVAARAKGCAVMHCASSGAPLLAGMPMVLTVHDVIPLVFDDGHSECQRQLFRRRLQRGLRQATQVICVSEHTRSDLLRLFPDIPAPLSVIHWGADPQPLPAPTTPLGPPTLVLFGGEARRKNTEYSVDRFVAAAKRVPTLRLQLLGVTSTRQLEALMPSLRHAGVADRVSIPGFVGERELSDLLRGSTALLYLSLYEGFGLPVLEAIAHGVPVLASDRSSLPEVLAGAQGCHALEDPQRIEDAIVRLATDPSARVSLLADQRRVLSRFRWLDSGARFAEVMRACGPSESGTTRSTLAGHVARRH